MTASPTHRRLLPWSHDGKPAVLVTDGTETFLSRLADAVEEQQIQTATVILGLAKPMVKGTANLSAHELRWIACRLVESLTDVLNICESRGRRIPPYDEADKDDE